MKALHPLLAVALVLAGLHGDAFAQQAKMLVIRKGVPNTYNGRTMMPSVYSAGKHAPSTPRTSAGMNAIVVKKGTPHFEGRILNTTPTGRPSASASAVKKPALHATGAITEAKKAATTNNSQTREGGAAVPYSNASAR
jgi:hypothetical protein